MKILFYVQHLLGIGHLKRAAALAAAMSEAGLDVTVAHGGEAVPDVTYPGARLVQLPPATIRDGKFSDLVDEHGNDVDDAWRDRRRNALLGLAKELRPDVVLFELFPFGRRQFRFELLPLIDEVWSWKKRPALLVSVRDILVRSSKAGREEETAKLVAEKFDAVLVHGDPAFAAFDDSFGPIAEIAGKLHYTGYVSGELGSPVPGAIADHTGDGEILVSAGGGSVGMPLMLAALEARPRSEAHGLTWRLLTGPRLPDADFSEVLQRAEAAKGDGGGEIIVERFRSDFTAVLPRAALSISQGGYNTTIDLLRAGVPAIIVPFGGDAETEQTDRAKRLTERGYLHVLPESELEGLAALIDKALADAPRRRAMAPVDFALDGAATTARLVASFAARAAT